MLFDFMLRSFTVQSLCTLTRKRSLGKLSLCKRTQACLRWNVCCKRTGTGRLRGRSLEWQSSITARQDMVIPKQQVY